MKREICMVCVLVLASVGGCDSSDGDPDGGPTTDAGEPDVDAGTLDAGEADVDGGAEDAGAPDAGPGRCPTREPEVVTFTTDDAITLEGDLYLSGESNGASVVLLHMIPPANDRTNYPRAFIDALVSRCITVLNVDRRGAGGSQGNAVDAYEGPNGAFDAKGAIEYLLDLPSEPDPVRTAVVGASNGTTTALDFTVFTELARTVELPAAVVMLSAGAYTENQNDIDTSLLVTVPTLFAYPAAESAYNEARMSVAPAGWSFQQYSPGAHGTRLFGAAPEAIGDVAGFLERALDP